MAKLEELESELYREEGKEDLEKRSRKKIFLSLPSSHLPHAWKEGEDEGEQAPRIPIFERRMTKILVGVFLSLVAIGGSFSLYLYFGSRPQEVEIRVEAREEIESGETLTIAIPYKNVSRAPLREIELTIILPPGTRIKEGGSEYEAPVRIAKSLSDLAPGEDRLEEITVRMFGREGDSGKTEVSLGYRPENVSARFTANASQFFRIVRVPLGVTWEIPDTLSEGQDVNMLVRYSSNSRDTFENLSLRIDFPPGFAFEDANPKPSEGTSIWNIGTLRSGGSGVIAIRGKITGEEGEIKTFRGGVGVYRYDLKSWTPYFDSFHEAKIAITPLVVRGRLDESRVSSINVGDLLRFEIQYQNNTPYPLKDVIVKSEISGSILEFQTMNISQGGVFDFPSRSIIWGPANHAQFRELPPGGAGVLTFFINTKQSPPVRTAEDKNLVVRLASHIEASGVPRELIGTDLAHDDVIEFKVNSKILFSGKALYTYSSLRNSGPVPPRVGQKTTYAVLWEIRNFTNGLKNAEVKTSLPPNVKWENAFIPSDRNIIYTQSSGEVKWKIGTIEAGKGVLTPALTAAFRVSIIPSEVDVGLPITLVNQSTFTADDDFTGKHAEMFLPFFTTQIPDDPIQRDGGAVKP